MTAPTVKRTEILDPNPTAPVIILIGGGEAGNPKGNPMIIDSPNMPFVDQSGATWHEASSTLPGRIKTLTLKRGDSKMLYCEAHSGSNVLMALKVYFESEEVFELGEVVDLDGSFFLQAKSTKIPFDAHEPSEKGEWNRSTCPLTSVPVKAEFRQRQIGAADDQLTLEYYFTSAVISLELDFDLSI